MASIPLDNTLTTQNKKNSFNNKYDVWGRMQKKDEKKEWTMLNLRRILSTESNFPNLKTACGNFHWECFFPQTWNSDGETPPHLSSGCENRQLGSYTGQNWKPKK